MTPKLEMVARRSPCERQSARMDVRQTDDLLAGFELSKRGALGHLTRLGGKVSPLKEFALTAPHLPMPVERVFAHPAVTMNAGRVALRHGPAGLLPRSGRQSRSPGRPVQRLRLPRAAALATAPHPEFGAGYWAESGGRWEKEQERPPQGPSQV